MSNVYAVGDATYRRHVTRDHVRTLCGREAGQHEPLALPVNCDECRTANGRLIRARMASPVIERSWYGDRMGTPNTMTREQYERDMADIRAWGEKANVWSGQDRQGVPLRVVWVTTPRMGAASLYVYEISGEG